MALLMAEQIWYGRRRKWQNCRFLLKSASILICGIALKQTDTDTGACTGTRKGITTQYLHRKTVELVRQVEMAGVAWITVHGRTPRTKSTQPVNLEAIKLVCTSFHMCNAEQPFFFFF
jgi:hypothetical protein